MSGRNPPPNPLGMSAETMELAIRLVESVHGELPTKRAARIVDAVLAALIDWDGLDEWRQETA